MTVHPGIGYDIIANHPVFNGAAIGRAAEWDFKLFGGSVEGLDGGVVLSIGSAIMGPQVFEKALSCVNNLRLQDGRDVVRGHTFYVVDLQDGGGWDWTQGEPPKTNPAYYLRFCKSYSRMGGALNYVQCDNADVPPPPLPPAGPAMNAERFAAITGAIPAAPRRGGRRLLPRPLPADRPVEGRDLDRDRPARPQRRRGPRASRARPGRSSTTSSRSGSARSTPSASAATTARATSCAGPWPRCPGVRLEHFLTAPSRRTPVYCKPLVDRAGPAAARAEPARLQELDADARRPPARPGRARRDAGRPGRRAHPARPGRPARDGRRDPPGDARRPTRRSTRPRGLVVLADSRRGLHDFPPLGFKMNAAELARMTGAAESADLDAVRRQAAELAGRTGRPVFVTLAERGIVGRLPGRAPEHVPALPVRGPIDIVGAGDAVTANLAAALAAGADAPRGDGARHGRRLARHPPARHHRHGGRSEIARSFATLHNSSMMHQHDTVPTVLRGNADFGGPRSFNRRGRPVSRFRRGRSGDNSGPCPSPSSSRFRSRDARRGSTRRRTSRRRAR